LSGDPLPPSGPSDGGAGIGAVSLEGAEAGAALAEAAGEADATSGAPLSGAADAAGFGCGGGRLAPRACANASVARASDAAIVPTARKRDVAMTEMLPSTIGEWKQKEREPQPPNGMNTLAPRVTRMSFTRWSSPTRTSRSTWSRTSKRSANHFPK